MVSVQLDPSFMRPIGQEASVVRRPAPPGLSSRASLGCAESLGPRSTAQKTV